MPAVVSTDPQMGAGEGGSLTGFKAAGAWSWPLSYIYSGGQEWVELYLCASMAWTGKRTPWSTVLLEKLTGPQLVKKSPNFLEPEGSLPHSQESGNCPYSEPHRSSPSPHPTSCRPILILSSHLRLGLPSGSSLRFPHQTPVCTSPRSHTCYMPCASHSSWLDHLSKIWWGVQSTKLLIM